MELDPLSVLLQLFSSPGKQPMPSGRAHAWRYRPPRSKRKAFFIPSGWSMQKNLNPSILLLLSFFACA